MNHEALFDEQIRAALVPPAGAVISGGAPLERLHARPRTRRRRRVQLLVVGLALGALGAGGGSAALAAAVMKSVPITIHVPNPPFWGNASPIPDLSIHLPYTTSLDGARRLARFHILTLPPSVGALESVTVVPPVMRADGKPVSEGEVMKPSFELLYRFQGMHLALIEDPVTPTPVLHVSVKEYGARSTHVAVVDGMNVTYSGSPDATYYVMLQTRGGMMVILRSDVDSSGRPLSLATWGKLLGQLS